MSARGRRRDHPPAARRGRHAARRRALLGGASRRPAGGAAVARSTTIPTSICGSAASSRTSVAHAKGLTVVQRRGNARHQELGAGADRRRRRLVDGARTAVSGRAAAILGHDRLARHARRHATAARIDRAAGAALDGAGRASRGLSDLGRAADQRRRDRAGRPGTGRAGARPATRLELKRLCRLALARRRRG